MSISSVNRWFQNCLNDVKQISDNKCRIANIQEDLAKFKNNPNFYRNKKIISIAASVAIIAVAAISAYFTFSLGAPLFIAAVSSFNPSSFTAGGLLMFMSAPFFGIGFLSKTLPSAFRSFKKDVKTSLILQSENAQLEQNLNDKITAKKFKVQRTQQQIAQINMELANIAK